jgi:hypothetical protein
MKSKNEELLEKYCYQQTYLTHGTISAASITYAVVIICSMFLNEKSIEEIYEELPKKVNNFEKKLNEMKEYKVKKNNPHGVSECLQNAIDFIKDYQKEMKENVDREFNHIELIEGLRTSISKKAKEYIYTKNTMAHVNQGAAYLGGIHGIIMSILPEFKISDDYKNELNIDYTNYCNFIIREICQIGYDTDTGSF